MNVTSKRRSRLECEDDHYDAVFRFPFIVVLRLISRLKLLQTGLTLLVVPPAVYQYHLGLLSDYVFHSVVSVATIAGLMLYVMSAYFRYVVGVISLHKTDDIVRFGTLSFWGNRRNVYVPVKEIVPLSELIDSPTDVYVKLRRYNDPKWKMLLVSRGGVIVDKKKFLHILGSVR